jgi:hypothetical protein
VSQAVTDTDPRHSNGRAAAILSGTLVGLVVGIAFDAVVWLWAFSRALAGDVGAGFPLVVQTATERGDVVAESGIGIFVIPVCCALIGIAIGWFVAKRFRGRHDDASPAPAR